MYTSTDELARDQMQAVHQGMVAAFMKELVMTRRCATCGQTFQYMTSIGQRQCRVHPLPLTTAELTSEQQLYHLGDRPSRSLRNHYRCCGVSATPEDGSDPSHDILLLRDGCCRADHNHVTRWHQIDTSGASDVVRVQYNRASRAEDIAFFYRLRILPLSVVLLALDQREAWYKQRRLPSPAAALWPKLQALGMNRQQQLQLIVDSFMGANSVIVGEDQYERLMRSNVQDRLVTIRSGTQRIQVDVREAYVSMCIAFALPHQILTMATSLMELRARTQEHRRLQEQATAEAGTETLQRRALYDPETFSLFEGRPARNGQDEMMLDQQEVKQEETVLVKLEQEAMSWATTSAEGARALGSVAGGSGAFHGFHPFVIGSWISEFEKRPLDAWDSFLETAVELPHRRDHVHGSFLTNIFAFPMDRPNFGFCATQS